MGKWSLLSGLLCFQRGEVPSQRDMLVSVQQDCFHAGQKCRTLGSIQQVLARLGVAGNCCKWLALEKKIYVEERRGKE